ncbi:MAG: type III-A CRISPR-associated RAMP protein Csm3 [Bacteroidota bacterium]
MAPELKANIIFRGKIKCLTGLHIGGSKDRLEIGGVDSPVLRDPYTRLPYIPGSSIKGRTRALLEYALGHINDGLNPKEEPGSVSTAKEIVSLFGKSAGDDDMKGKELKKVLENHPGPTPLIVRDALPDEHTIGMWKSLEGELQFTEYKPENTINRLTSAANPRFLERVVAGSQFDFQAVYSVYDRKEGENSTYIERVNRDLKNFLMGLRLVEDHALGKSGSRGYGQVQFKLAAPVVVKMEEYKAPTEQRMISRTPLEEDQLKTLDNELFINYQYTE